MWKFQTPEPERGGVTTTASGLGFAGGGDGVLRAFDTRNGKVLWTFQTGRQIAAGPTVYLVGGKQYIAITVGGTPTSSNGGVGDASSRSSRSAARKQQSPPPTDAAARSGRPPAARRRPTRDRLAARRRDAGACARARRGARRAHDLTVGADPFVRRLAADRRRTSRSSIGRLLLGGAPVRGARIRVDRYQLLQR